MKSNEEKAVNAKTSKGSKTSVLRTTLYIAMSEQA